MDKNYSTKQVADLFEVDSQTIRRWGIAFKEFFSPTAVPDNARTRQFTEDDLQVIAFIAQLKQHRTPKEDIYLALANRDTSKTIAIPEPSNLVIATGTNKLRLLTEQLTIRNNEVIRLNALLEASKDNLTEAKQDINGLQQERINLHRQIATLQAKLEALEGKE